MLYQPPTGGAANDSYVGANPGLGIQGSRLPPKAAEQPQREIVQAIADSGQTPSDSDLTQLSKAIHTAVTTAVTKTVYGTSPDFATLREAFDWISRRRISMTGSVTLQLRAGQFTHAGSGNSIDFYHPDGARISIAGATMAGTFPVNSAFAATGPGATARAADSGTNLALLRAAFGTEIRLTGGATANFRGAVGAAAKILFTGDGTAVDGPSFLNGSGSLSEIAGHGFGSRGVVLSGGGGWGVSKVVGVGNAGPGVFAAGCYVAVTGLVGGYNNAGDGVSVAAGASVSNAGGTVNGNGNAGEGVICDSSTSICGAGSTGNTNGKNGFRAVSAIKMDCSSCTASANSVSGTGTGVGFSATDDSFMDARNSGGTGNLYGYVAGIGSTINSTGGGANGSVTQYVPALNVIGNGNSIIIG